MRVKRRKTDRLDALPSQASLAASSKYIFQCLCCKCTQDLHRARVSFHCQMQSKRGIEAERERNYNYIYTCNPTAAILSFFLNSQLANWTRSQVLKLRRSDRLLYLSLPQVLESITKELVKIIFFPLLSLWIPTPEEGWNKAVETS